MRNKALLMLKGKVLDTESPTDETGRLRSGDGFVWGRARKPSIPLSGVMRRFSPENNGPLPQERIQAWIRIRKALQTDAKAPQTSRYALLQRPDRGIVGDEGLDKG